MFEIKTLTLGELGTNCYFFIPNQLKKNIIIIDPADQFEVIDKFITENQYILNHIILTHCHFDHIGALNELISKYKPIVIANLYDKPLLDDPMLNLSARFEGKNLTVKSDLIDFVCDESKDILGEKFTFISTPGHTPGSMCICVKDIMFTGDTLFYNSIGNAFPPYGDTDLEIRSIKTKLYSLKADFRCFPGHGIQTTLFFEKATNPYTGDFYCGY